MWKSYGPGGGYFGVGWYKDDDDEGCEGGGRSRADENLSEFLEGQQYLVLKNLGQTDQQYLNENNLEGQHGALKPFACHEANDLRSEAGADGDDGQRSKAHEVNRLGHRFSELLKFAAGVEVIQMRDENAVVRADDGDEYTVKFRCRRVESHGLRVAGATEVYDVEGGVEGEENHVDAHGEDGEHELSHAAEAETEMDVALGVAPIDEGVYCHLRDGHVEVGRIIIAGTNEDEDGNDVERSNQHGSQRDVAKVLHALKEPLNEHYVEDNLRRTNVIELPMFG